MTLKLAAPAQRDVREISLYYEQASPSLGLRLANELEGTLAYLAANPGLGMWLSARTRRWLLKTFPYIVLYRAGEDELLVVRVVHQKRDPKLWQSAL